MIRYDMMKVKPKIAKVKSHVTPEEMVVYGRNNPDIDKWVISNECADAAAGAEADHKGGHGVS